MENDQKKLPKINSPDLKIRKFKVRRNGQWCVMGLDGAIEELRLDFSESEPGDKTTFEIVEMTQFQIDSLPEHEGW